MPVSKHRVKKNGKRPVRKDKMNLQAIFVTDKQKADLKALFTRVEMIAETKLVRGACNFEDVAQIRDVLNFCAWASVYWGEVADILSDEWIEESLPIFLKAQEAFHTFYGRGNDKGGVNDPTVRYVATGDELNAIRDGVAVAGDMCQQMLDKNPCTFLKLWFSMKEFLKNKGAGKLEFDGDKLAQSIRRS